MKNLCIAIFVLFITLTINAQTSVITLKGKSDRINALNDAMTGYAASQNKDVTFSLISNSGYTRKGDVRPGEWVAVYVNNILFGQVQMSPKMLLKIQNAVKDTSNVSSYMAIFELCQKQLFVAQGAVDTCSSKQVTTTAPKETKIIIKEVVVETPSNNGDPIIDNFCRFYQDEVVMINSNYQNGSMFYTEAQANAKMYETYLKSPDCFPYIPTVQKAHKFGLWLEENAPEIVFGTLNLVQLNKIKKEIRNTRSSNPQSNENDTWGPNDSGSNTNGSNSSGDGYGSNSSGSGNYANRTYNQRSNTTQTRSERMAAARNNTANRSAQTRTTTRTNRSYVNSRTTNSRRQSISSTHTNRRVTSTSRSTRSTTRTSRSTQTNRIATTSRSQNSQRSTTFRSRRPSRG